MHHDAARGQAPHLPGRVALAVEPGPGRLVETDHWLDEQAWTQLTLSGPSGRDGAAMATLGGTIVLFGGESSGESYLGDTWTFDGTAWTQKQVSGPSPRSESAIASVNGKVVLFSGNGSQLGDDTLTWDGTSWTQQNVSGPLPRGGV